MTEQMQELLQQKQRLISQGEECQKTKDFAGLKTVNESIKNLNHQIDTLAEFETVQKKETSNDVHVTNITASESKKMPFNSLGEQLKAVAEFRKNGNFDNRLKVVNSLMGQNETNGGDGGFAIQSDFAGAIFDAIREESDIISRVNIFEVSSPSNSARWYMPKNGNDGSFGVKMHWAAEGTTAASSKIGLIETRLDLEKMMGFAYASDEMLQDSALINSLFTPAFTASANELLTDAIISGDGVGKPLGILKSKCLLSVAKEQGQSEKIIAENIARIYASMPSKLRKNAVWLVHPDLAEKLPFMEFKIGQGGVPVFLPTTGLAASPLSTLYGLPIIEDDNCAALGSQGDIILADLKQYMLLKKGTIKQDVSMHVEFLTDQMCFRYVMRVNGAPLRNEPFVLKNSNQKRSPFVTLASR